MDKNYYYTGTDYSSMHPFHWEFWYHMFIPWTWYNWVWLVLILLILAVKINDGFVTAVMKRYEL